jgi:pyrimidine operon attenuation protein/uracil phosphoribosyltransferase
MQTKEARVGKLEKQLTRRETKLDELLAKAKEAGADIKGDYHSHVDDLKLKHQTVRSKLEELKVAGGEEWMSLVNGVDSAFSELEAAFKKLTA